LTRMQTREVTHTLSILDRDATEGLLRSFWELLLRDAARAVDRYCTPDVTYRILDANPGEPGWVVAEGREAAMMAIATINDQLEFLAFEIDAMVIDLPRVAVRWHAAFRHRETGVVGDLCFFDDVEFAGGLISRYTVFMDTNSFRALLAGRAQSPLARKAHRRAAASCLQLPRPFVLSLPERDEREHFLRSFWATRERSGAAAVMQRMTPDTELCLLGDPAAIPFARHLKGVQAVIDLANQVDIEFEITSREVLHVIVEGHQAAVRWAAELRHRGTSARGLIESFDHVVFRDGKIASTTRFFDTAGMVSWIEG
jgi:ketosteroid isomerase-like protein